MCIIDEVSIVIQFINKKVFLNFLLYFLSNPILQNEQNKYFKLPMLSCPVINFSIPYTYRVLQVVVFIQFRIWWFQKKFDLNILNISNVSYKCVVPGGAGVAMALPDFGRSVNPISRFSYLRLPTALKSCRKTVDENMSYFYYWYIRLFRLKNFMNPQI